MPLTDSEKFIVLRDILRGAAHEGKALYPPDIRKILYLVSGEADAEDGQAPEKNQKK